MTQEEKSLLLQDLCARLPHGVECLAGDVVVGKLVGIVPYAGEIYLYLRGVLTPYRLDEVKPYLRPIDSLTEEDNAPNTDPNRYSAADLFYAGVEAGCNLNTPAEWSEEDERMLNHIIGYLHSGDDFQTGIDWMKSLKERYTWKPSDEQLDALHDAAVYVDKSMFPHPKGILMKLYKQLKKLREE